MQVKQEGLTKAQRDLVRAALKRASKCTLRKYKTCRKVDKTLDVQTEATMEKHYTRWG